MPAIALVSKVDNSIIRTTIIANGVPLPELSASKPFRWHVIIDVPPKYDSATQYLTKDSPTVQGASIVVKYVINNKTPEAIAAEALPALLKFKFDMAIANGDPIEGMKIIKQKGLFG